MRRAGLCDEAGIGRAAASHYPRDGRGATASFDKHSDDVIVTRSEQVIARGDGVLSFLMLVFLLSSIISDI
jgi:hypothetical protein